MFKLIFAKTYDFAIMERNNLNHVLEDYYKSSENAFCVADGITRDFINGKPLLQYPITLDEANYIIENYPNPSGATKAAKICSENFIKYISEFEKSKITSNTLKKVIKKINRDIHEINKNRKIDYLANDIYACCATGGIFKDDEFLYFAIGDCKIMLIDEDYNIISDTSSSQEFNNYKEALYTKICTKNKTWKDEKYRIYIRKVMRNNLLFKFLKLRTFGALTGEKKALNFVKIYKTRLDKVKYILAFSDGCEECLKTKEQILSVINNPEQIVNEKHEKTLLIYEKK